MRFGDRRWFAPALLTLLLALTGCSRAAGFEEETASDPAAKVETGDGSQPARITLTEAAEQRLGIETTPVVARTAKSGSGPTLVIPYSAVVYDAAGKAWAFASLSPRTYRREPVAIRSIENDLVTLTSGPTPGTELVTVGAPELVGAEAGISGEE
jgi:hypothetical protein